MGNRSFLVSLYSDDAFYYLNVARNLVQNGNPPSFDGLTITTGFHPLYLLYLTILFKFLQPGIDTFVRLSLFSNILFHFVTAYIFYCWGKRLVDPKTGRITAFLFLANPYTMLWPLTGMEASLNALMLSSFMYLLFRYTSQSALSSLWLSALFAGLATLARVDNMIVVVSVVLLAYYFKKIKIKTVIPLISVPLFFLGGWMIYCHQLTGDWIQGSARMKTIFRQMETEGFASIQHFTYAADIFFKFIFKSCLKVPVLKYIILLGTFITLWKNNKYLIWIYSLPILILSFAYAYATPGIQTWYYVPPVILLTVLCLYAWPYLWKNGLFQKKYGVALLVILLGVESLVYGGIKIFRGRNRYQKNNLIVAEALADQIPKGSRVGSWNAGIYGYYSGRQIINLDGLINNEIAYYVQHNQFNWPYWKDREIDFLLDSKKCFRNIPHEYEDLRLELIGEYTLSVDRQPICLFHITTQKSENL